MFWMSYDRYNGNSSCWMVQTWSMVCLWCLVSEIFIVLSFSLCVRCHTAYTAAAGDDGWFSLWCFVSFMMVLICERVVTTGAVWKGMWTRRDWSTLELFLLFELVCLWCPASACQLLQFVKYFLFRCQQFEFVLSVKWLVNHLWELKQEPMMIFFWCYDVFVYVLIGTVAAVVDVWFKLETMVYFYDAMWVQYLLFYIVWCLCEMSYDICSSCWWCWMAHCMMFCYFYDSFDRKKSGNNRQYERRSKKTQVWFCFDKREWKRSCLSRLCLSWLVSLWVWELFDFFFVFEREGDQQHEFVCFASEVTGEPCVGLETAVNGDIFWCFMYVLIGIRTVATEVDRWIKRETMVCVELWKYSILVNQCAFVQLYIDKIGQIKQNERQNRIELTRNDKLKNVWSCSNLIFIFRVRCWYCVLIWF